MDKTQSEQQSLAAFQRSIDMDLELEGLVELDPEAEPDDYDYNSFAARFRAGMAARSIQVTGGTYESCNSEMQFLCEECGYTWTTLAKNVQQRGCPRCRQRLRNIEKSKRLWARSKEIIKDKKGVIVQFPDNDPDRIPSIGDKFLLKCKPLGHKFTTTHRKLANNQWCPICATTNDGTKNLKSDAAYKKKMTNAEKFERLKEIAGIKGARIVNGHWQDIEYDLICNHCFEEFQKTTKQILDNFYICPKRCQKSGKWSIQLGPKERK